jgi:cytoskeletal protein CcmA (bactofilin family)
MLFVAGGADAQVRRSHAPDSDRVVRRITINNQGIEIEHGSQDEEDSNRDRNRLRRRIEVNGDTLTFGRRTRFVGPGIVVDTDESGLVRMFSDAEVPKGERVEGDVVAIFGSVLVEGEVSGNVVAVIGSVTLRPGAVVDGDAVAIGGVLDQARGATVSGESVSLGFISHSPHWGAPTLGVLLGLVVVGWLIALFMGWILALLFPTRMLRIAATASRRTGASLLLGLLSKPLLIILIVLLLVTVIGIPIAVLLPVGYILAAWAGQLAVIYVLGCRLLRRGLGEGSLMVPIVAGTLFVAMFFALGTLLAGPAGALRTVALFFVLLGALLVIGVSVIGIGAFLLSRAGSRPREVEFRGAAPSAVSAGPAAGPAPGSAPPAPAVPPAAPGA